MMESVGNVEIFMMMECDTCIGKNEIVKMECDINIYISKTEMYCDDGEMVLFSKAEICLGTMMEIPILVRSW